MLKIIFFPEVEKLEYKCREEGKVAEGKEVNKWVV